MLYKSDIKLIRSLSLKKYRQRYKKFVVEGEKSVLEAIKFKKDQLSKIFITKEFNDENSDTLLGIEQLVEKISTNELNSISNLTNNTTAIAILRMQEENDISILTKSNVVLYLDKITDPGNLGTLIRSCDWFGVDALVCSSDSVDLFNPKVIQSSMGSLFRIPVFVMDFYDLQNLMDKFKIYATDLEGENIYDIQFKTPLILIAGNESNGISEDILKNVTHCIKIPGKGINIDSLNVGVATSIVLSEIFRREIK